MLRHRYGGLGLGLGEVQCYATGMVATKGTGAMVTASPNPTNPNPNPDPNPKKVQFDSNDEGDSVKERPFPSEMAVVSGQGSRPDGVIWFMKTKTVIWMELTSP